MEKKINLKEILFSRIDKYRQEYRKDNLMTNEEMEESKEFPFFIDAMKEACNQALGLAAEEAKIEAFSIYKLGINKQSIFNVLNKVK